MKAHGLKLAAVAFALCAILLFVPALDMAGATLTIDPGLQLTGLQLATGLVALRADLTALEQRAKDKLAEIKDGLKPEEVRAIEEAHGKILDEVKAKKREIETAETAEAEEVKKRNQPKAWSSDEVAKIQARAKGFGLSGDDALAVMADPKVRTIDEATDALQNKLAGRDNPRTLPNTELRADEGDKLRNVVGDAILLRANPQAIAGTDQAGRDRIAAARHFRGMSLLEVGRAFMLDARGVNLRGLSRMETATVLLGMRNAGDFGITVRAGMHSTSDFANILANVASKRLRDAYAAYPQQWKEFCRQSNNPDFKEKSVTQLSSAPKFKQVREGAEFTYGGMTDGVEKYSLATYGRIVAISRQAIINDDLNAFDRLPTMVGRAAATLENTTVYAILLDNSAMNDGVALFHADHGNLLSGTAIDETNLALAEKALMEQTTLGDQTEDKEKLNLRPAFLLTGTAYKVAAQKILTAVQATATSGVNPFAGTMKPIADANITGNKWFVIANPMDIDTIEYSYLEGEEGVFIEQRMGFEVDGIEVKGRLDFAAKAIDHRGMAYNPGA